MGTLERTSRSSPGSPSTPAGFERVLELLASHHGIESRDYKQGTLRRRTARRMEQLGFSEWSAYAAYLERHPDELVALYRDVLIKVTRFFRDPAQWEHLEQEIVPRLVKDRADDSRPIRIWSAGCATGEESLGLAMIFLEQIERLGSSATLQVFATDISQDAVTFARHGLYPKSIAHDVSPQRLSRFFSEHPNGYHINREVRERVTVGYHDLLSDPPFSWLDLLVCRNLLIYLEPHAQQECLRRFQFSLLPHGVLWLGRAESIDRQDDRFRAIVPEHRMYERVESHRRGALAWSMRTSAAGTHASPPSSVLMRSSPVRITRSLERFVLTHRTLACVVIDRAGHMLRLFGPTSQYLVHPQGEVRPELLAWVDPRLYVELRPALARSFERGEEAVVTGAHVQRGDQIVPISCTIEPLHDIDEGLWLVTFRDEPWSMPAVASTDHDALVRELGRELQETKTELRRALDDIGGIEADHAVAQEELTSINEELQASNDALTSSEAEAQSVNEELQTVNRELEERNARLHASNADLENLLAVTEVPTLFLDRRLCVRRFAASAPGVMQVTREDLGRPLELVAPRVAGERLLDDATRVLEHLLPVEATVRNADGRTYRRRIVPYRFEGRVDGVCITFVDHALAPPEPATEADAPASPQCLVFDHALRVVAASEALQRAFALAWREGEALPLSSLGEGPWSSPAVRDLLERTLREHDAVPPLALALAGPDPRELRLRACRLASPGGTPLVLLSIEDAARRPAEPQAAAPGHAPPHRDRDAEP